MSAKCIAALVMAGLTILGLLIWGIVEWTSSGAEDKDNVNFGVQERSSDLLELDP